MTEKTIKLSPGKKFREMVDAFIAAHEKVGVKLTRSRAVQELARYGMQSIDFWIWNEQGIVVSNPDYDPTQRQVSTDIDIPQWGGDRKSNKT